MWVLDTPWGVDVGTTLLDTPWGVDVGTTLLDTPWGVHVGTTLLDTPWGDSELTQSLIAFSSQHRERAYKPPPCMVVAIHQD